MYCVKVARDEARLVMYSSPPVGSNPLVLVSDPYPYLEHLLAAYFHQDAFDDGETDEEIIRVFKTTSRAYEVLGARADIERFLAQHGGRGLSRALNGAFRHQVVLGESDEEARMWLARTLELLSR